MLRKAITGAYPFDDTGRSNSPPARLVKKVTDHLAGTDMNAETVIRPELIVPELILGGPFQINYKIVPGIFKSIFVGAGTLFITYVLGVTVLGPLGDERNADRYRGSGKRNNI